MTVQNKYALIDEMREVPALLREFDPSVTQRWSDSIFSDKRLCVTGEGSSRIFPAKNMIERAATVKPDLHVITQGARQAADYDLTHRTLIGLSNSGQTRETVSLFKKRPALNHYAVTATDGSALHEVADSTILLNCGAERAVAATKSVVEQALVLQSILKGPEWLHKGQAADIFLNILDRDCDDEICSAICDAANIYFAGRNDGVSEELALKTNEIIRKKSCFLEGTYVLHGIEEILDNTDTIVLIEPFEEEMDRYQKIGTSTGASIVAIASTDTPFPTFQIPKMDGFNGYFQLLAGWNILVKAGLRLTIDLDKPLRARKIGNPL